MWIRRLSELAFVASLLTFAGSARAQPGDAMAEYRERFRHGMERYRERAFAEAIADWQPIYADLGPVRGYRLAYDLGVAYAESGDPTRAVEHLQAFVTEADARRARGEALEDIVTKEEADAQTRLAALLPQVPPSERPPAPPTTPEAPPAPAATPEPTLEPTPVLAPVLAPEPTSTPAPAPRPIALPVLAAVSGGLAVASAIAAVPLEAHALSLHDQYVVAQTQSASHSIPASDRQAFATARTLAYAAIGGAAGFSGVAAGCAAWYFFGPFRREGALAALVEPERRGASFQFSAAF